MVLKSDKEKVKTLLSETIRLLCKNGLHFRAEFSVEALVGITLDQEEEFFLSIKETVKTDLVSSTKDTVHHEHKPKRVREHIKGEPGTSSRKRGAETVTSEGEDLGGLSLGDIQEGEQSFWSTVTDSGGSGGGHPGGTPFKKRHIEPNREDSSSSAPQIVVKGEPESDSDIEEVASTSGADPASTQMAHMGDSFAFGSQAGAPVGYTGLPQQSAIPPQVWDQLPPFSSLPGTSGIQSATNTVTSPDGHQQAILTVVAKATTDTPILSTKTLTSLGIASNAAPWIPTLQQSLPAVTTPAVPAPLVVYKERPGHHSKYSCPTCSTPCVNKGSLLRHMKIHLEQPEFRCATCGQSYYEKWRLVRHMKAKNHGVEHAQPPPPPPAVVATQPSATPAQQPQVSAQPPQPQLVRALPLNMSTIASPGPSPLNMSIIASPGPSPLPSYKHVL